jgi:hypothetical protein
MLTRGLMSFWACTWACVREFACVRARARACVRVRGVRDKGIAMSRRAYATWRYPLSREIPPDASESCSLAKLSHSN